MSRAYAIASGKGGVGKTTVTAALGGYLAALGLSVAVVDSDSGLRNLDAVLGLENKIVFDVRDVMEGVCGLEKAMIRDWQRPGLSLLSGASDAQGITPERMRGLVQELCSRYDIVLIDCPAGIEQGFYTAIAAANEGIIVTTPDVTAVRDACTAGERMRREGLQPRLIINRSNPRMERKGNLIPAEEVAEITELPVLGVICEDRSVAAAGNRGSILEKRSRAGKALQAIARILAEEAAQKEEKEQYE